MKTHLFILLTFAVVFISNCKKNDPEPTPTPNPTTPVDTTTYVTLGVITNYQGIAAKNSEVRIDEDRYKLVQRLGNYQYVNFTDSIGICYTKVKIRKYYIMAYIKGNGKLDSIITSAKYHDTIYKSINRN